MPSLDDEIDALYQLAPAEFTAKRNELIKRAGTRAAEVKALAKPSAPAWAVNQLYWHRRPVFDALVKASEARRAAHVRQVAGKSADLELADARHRAALDAAVEAATALLRQSGDAASAATVDVLTRTLEAVPSPEVRGRLTRPIESMGFSALAALMTGKSGPALPRQPADVVVMKRRGEAGTDVNVGVAPRGRQPARPSAASASRAEEQRAADQARRAEEERRQRERDRLKKALAAAQAKEREAATALTKARQAAERANARVEQMEHDLDDARRALSNRREDAERARRAINDAVAERVAIERQLQDS